MKNSLSKVTIFAAGAIIGSAVTWKFVKAKYERIAQEEIDSYKEYCEDKYSESKRYLEEVAEPFAEGLAEGLENDIASEEVTINRVKPSLNDYAAMVQGQGYTDYSNNSKSEKNTEEMTDVERPYVIEPEAYGECGYETIELTYYSDGVLADDMDNIVDDVDDIVGRNSLNQFGEYEDDSVHVRNDRLKCDYEILLDHRNYSDVIKSSPHRAEAE